MKDLISIKLNSQIKNYIKREAEKNKTTITAYLESLILKEIFKKKGGKNNGGK